MDVSSLSTEFSAIGCTLLVLLLLARRTLEVASVEEVDASLDDDFLFVVDLDFASSSQLESFTSSVSMILREVVSTINVHLCFEILWPKGATLHSIESDFRELSGLLGIAGAIPGTHIAISKPRVGLSDYYYFKLGRYIANCQAVVDSWKRFLDFYLGMPGSTNDSHVLRHSTLFKKRQDNTLWDENFYYEGILLYLVGDSGYPLLLWLLVPQT